MASTVDLINHEADVQQPQGVKEESGNHRDRDHSVDNDDSEVDDDASFKPLKNPKSMDWHQSISYTQYVRVLEGYSPISMDDKFAWACDEPDPSTGNRGAVHIYHTWDGEEQLRGEFYLNEDARPETSGPYATFDKLSWETQRDEWWTEDRVKRFMLSVICRD